MQPILKDKKYDRVYCAVTVDKDGQIVIPEQLRAAFGLKSGDELLVFAKKGYLELISPSVSVNIKTSKEKIIKA